jgi:hypothetical protein
MVDGLCLFVALLCSSFLIMHIPEHVRLAADKGPSSR